MGKSATKRQQRPPELNLHEASQKAIYIVVGWQGDGGVYRLFPSSKERILEHFPDALVNSDGMLVGYDKYRDYERYHRPYWKEMAKMLTGLSEEQIASLGGVRIYQPVVEKQIWEWLPETVNH